MTKHRTWKQEEAATSSPESAVVIQPNTNGNSARVVDGKTSEASESIISSSWCDSDVGYQVSSSEPPGTADSFEGSYVSFDGERMLCIKETKDAQVRLQRGDGRTTWASRKSVALV